METACCGERKGPKKRFKKQIFDLISAIFGVKKNPRSVENYWIVLKFGMMVP